MGRSLPLLFSVLAAGLLLVAVTLPSQEHRRELFSKENRYGSLSASPDAHPIVESQTQENLAGSLAVSAKGTDHDIGGMLTDKALEDKKNTQGSLLQQAAKSGTDSSKLSAKEDSNMAGSLAGFEGDGEERNMKGSVASILDSDEARNTQGTLSVIDGKDEERNKLGTVSFIDKTDDERNRMGTLSLASTGDHVNMIGSVEAVTSKLDQYNENGDLLNVDDSKDPVNRDGKPSLCECV